MLQKSNQVSKKSGIHRPLVSGNNWMITTDHPLATQAGASVRKIRGQVLKYRY
jgi:gamma-glutamyltranspeptidase